MQSNEAVAKGYLDKVGDSLKQKGVTVKSEVRFGKTAEENAAEEIMKFANEIHADAVATSTHVRSYAGHWLFGSVAERLLHKADIPLLIVRAPEGSGAEHLATEASFMGGLPAQGSGCG